MSQSKVSASCSDPILPHWTFYHKGELALLVTGVALIALAFILQNQSIVQEAGFISFVSGGSVLAIASLILLVKRHIEKYEFTKDDLNLIEKEYDFEVAEAQTFNSQRSIENVGISQFDRAFTGFLNELKFNGVQNGVQVVFSYKKKNESSFTMINLKSQNKDDAKAEILYILRLIRNHDPILHLLIA